MWVFGYAFWPCGDCHVKTVFMVQENFGKSDLMFDSVQTTLNMIEQNIIVLRLLFVIAKPLEFLKG